jgi:hypothetical protein
MNKQNIKSIAVALLVSFTLSAQTLTNKQGSEYKFSVVINNEATPVVSQGITGTIRQRAGSVR